MRILLYAINYAPELTGCGKYTGEMARWLAERGHDVDVVTAAPYYPEWAVKPGYSATRYTYELEPTSNKAIRVWRCPLYVPARVTGKTRLLHLASFALFSGPALLRTLCARPDILFLVLPTMACAPAALMFGPLFGAKTWAHIQDFEVDAAFGIGVIHGGVVRRIASAVETSLLKAFNRVSSITAKMLERAGAKGVAKEKSFMFPNWVDLNAVFPIPGPNAFRQQLGIPDHHVMLLYSGNMGEKQGLEILVEAAKALQSCEYIHFVLVGAGAARARMQELSTGLTNVRWLDLQPADRLNLMLNAADIHLLPQRADAADLVMPSKLTGMLASAKAIVGTAEKNTALGAVLDDVGVRTMPGNAQDFANALRKLAELPDERARLGRLARQYAEQNLDRNVIMGRFLEQAEICCSPK